jgi:hypothetical protein
LTATIRHVKQSHGMSVLNEALSLAPAKAVLKVSAWNIALGCETGPSSLLTSVAALQPKRLSGEVIQRRRRRSWPGPYQYAQALTAIQARRWEIQIEVTSQNSRAGCLAWR